MNENVVVSYSKYNSWQNCPLKYKYAYLDRLKEPSSETLEHGNQIHKQMEEYLKLDGMPIPACVHPELVRLVKLVKLAKPEIEAWWALNDKLEKCGSWDADVAFRSKIDFCFIANNTLVIGDWKTGKVRPKTLEQLEFYAFKAFILYPEVEQVRIELYYLEHGTLVSHAYSRSEAENLKTRWLARLEPFKKALTFPPNVTPLCGWCGFSKTKGGPCTAA